MRVLPACAIECHLLEVIGNTARQFEANAHACVKININSTVAQVKLFLRVDRGLEGGAPRRL
jgi:hypothetical protein